MKVFWHVTDSSRATSQEIDALRAEGETLGELSVLHCRVSIGTNDLRQYTCTADWMCGDPADLIDPWRPALLQLLSLCATAGHEAGKPVGVCGEAASHPFAPVLVGLGLTSQSMSVACVPAVHSAFAPHTREECTELARRALGARDAQQPRAVVLERTRR